MTTPEYRPGEMALVLMKAALPLLEAALEADGAELLERAIRRVDPAFERLVHAHDAP